MVGRGGIHDSDKYRQPTEAEAIELKRLYDILSKSLCRDDDVAYGLAVARMRALLKEMEKKKP